MKPRSDSGAAKRRQTGGLGRKPGFDDARLQSLAETIADENAAAASGASDLEQIIARLTADPFATLMVSSSLAKEILEANLSIEVGPHTRFFRVRSLGWGNYSVTLAPSGARAITLLTR